MGLETLKIIECVLRAMRVIKAAPLNGKEQMFSNLSDYQTLIMSTLRLHDSFELS